MGGNDFSRLGSGKKELPPILPVLALYTASHPPVQISDVHRRSALYDSNYFFLQDLNSVGALFYHLNTEIFEM